MTQPKDEAAFSFEDMAFASAGKELVKADARSQIRFDQKTTLSVEWFSKDESSWPVLAYCHGVFESAETWSVQHLARMCVQSGWRLAVLELEGHGLSSGKAHQCTSFERLVDQTEAFCSHIATLAPKKEAETPLPFALCGASLGGILAFYAAARVANQESKELLSGFCGAALICPAVGVAPEAVPPKTIVAALTVLSWVAPSKGFMTPMENSQHYACPESSKRNFSGQWPLAVSKMLLDVTTTRVQTDLDAKGGIEGVDKIPALLVITGEKDDVVPVDCVQDFCNKLPLSEDTKACVSIPKGGHDLLVDRKSSEKALVQLSNWLKLRFVTAQ